MFWQIVLEGFDNLSGESLSEFISSIARNTSQRFVSLTFFEGAGILEPIQRFQGEGFIHVEELVRAVSQLIQVEWATLVFSKTGLEKSDYNDYEARFARFLVDGLTVVRFVDGQFVYIYTGDDALKEYVCRQYEFESMDKRAPESFEWPD